MTDARHHRASETLRDGTVVTIRAARADDRHRIAQAFGRLDRDSLYTRFFTYRKALSDAELARVGAMDFVREAMLVATIVTPDEETIIASARYIAHERDAHSAEIAFVVEEDYQGRGLARCLLGHLAELARRAGITRFEADVLPDNKPMLAVFERSGWAIEKRRGDGVVHVQLAIGKRAADR